MFPSQARSLEFDPSIDLKSQACGVCHPGKAGRSLGLAGQSASLTGEPQFSVRDCLRKLGR